jgi:hypothetical protein
MKEVHQMKLTNIFTQTCLIILMVFNMNVFAQVGINTSPIITESSLLSSRGGMYVDDTWVWIADDQNGLWRINKCDGTNDGYTTTDAYLKLSDIHHAGNYIYAVGYSSRFSFLGLVIYDDINGQIVGQAPAPSMSFSQNSIYAIGDYAYMGGLRGIEIFNISDPANPFHVRTIETTKDFDAIRGAGDYFYAGQITDDQLYIYDISTDPSNPTLRGTWDPNITDNIGRQYVDEANNLVYVIDNRQGFYIVDVSNPDAPTTKNSIVLDGSSSAYNNGVHVQNNWAIVAATDTYSGPIIHWINVTDPTRPRVEDSANMSGNRNYDVYLMGCHIHVAADGQYKKYEMEGFQPDAQISNTDESNYVGDDIYDITVWDQRKLQTISWGDSAIYKIKLENESYRKQSLKVDVTTPGPGWTFIYLDENNTDISAQVQNGTFLTDSLEYQESTVITLKMVPDETVPIGDRDGDVITVTAGKCVTDDCVASELDIVRANVYYNSGPASIGDLVWNDVNGNAWPDAGENGIANVILYLTNTTGDTIATDTTDTNGNYLFYPLGAGTYTVHVKNASLPPYYWTTTDNDPKLINLSSGNEYLWADFGYNELPSSDYDPTGFIYDEANGEIITGGLVTASGPGQITYLKDGSTGEYVFYTDGTPGLYTITLTVPPGYVSSTTCLPLDPPPFDPTGQSNPIILGNGENGTTGFLTSNACTPFYYTFNLEDGDPYIINNNFPLQTATYDFGDAPDPDYPTLLANNGARHLLGSGLFMGTSVDEDTDGQPNATSTGDDNDGSDDDDGVTFTSPLMQSFQNSIDVVTSADGYINGWMDFNNDGDWDDANEQIINGQAVTTGTNTINIQIPLIDETGLLRTIDVASRFRFSSQQALNYNGTAPDGEVEDYAIDVLIPVEIAAFEVISVEGMVKISWSTFTETENLGFRIFRSESEYGQYKIITQEMIPGAGNSANKKSYKYVDDTAKAGETYFYKLADYSLRGDKRMHKPVKVFVELPSEHSLKQNFPNPFNPETKISFSLKEAGKVQLKIYNMQGQVVTTLINRNTGPGAYNVTWNGTNSLGQIVPSGVYYYELQVNDFKQSRKMILTK